MNNSTNTDELHWGNAATTKAKHAVQRCVTALLNQLAPERVLKRVDEPQRAVEHYRTLSGCVLQAGTAAISVSWFPETGIDAAIGELQVTVWNGTVTRRGAPKTRTPATTVAEFVLRPLEPPINGFVWEANDGTQYDTDTLAAKCNALLQAEIARQD